MRRILSLLIASLALTVGCRVFDEGGADVPSGTYFYEVFDAFGSSIAAGRMRIDARRGETSQSWVLEGTWEASPVNQPRVEVGPQTGAGRLLGWVESDGTYSIDMHPDYRDNNVVLFGEIERRRYENLEGAWQYISFTGPTAEGTFVARRESLNPAK